MAVLKDKHVLYLSSEDSLDIYPTNKPFDFTAELPENIRLPGKWQVALHSVMFKERIVDWMAICSDLCESSVIGDTKQQVLRRIGPNSARIQEFSNLIWLDVSRDDLKRVRVFLRLRNMAEPTFMTKPVTCTLELKRQL